MDNAVQLNTNAVAAFSSDSFENIPGLDGGSFEIANHLTSSATASESNGVGDNGFSLSAKGNSKNPFLSAANLPYTKQHIAEGRENFDPITTNSQGKTVAL